MTWDFKTADLLGPSAYPAEQPQASEDEDMAAQPFPMLDPWGQPVLPPDAQQLYWREHGPNVDIAKVPFKGAKTIKVAGKTAVVSKITPGLQDWADDMGYKLAEYPGGGNMLDHMRVREDNELFNNGDPQFQPERSLQDREPSSYECPRCGEKLPDFGQFSLHMDEHDGRPEDDTQDGHFPGLPLGDEPLGFGTNPQGTAGDAIAKVASTMQWQPGQWGKGMLINGEPHTWNTEVTNQYQPYLGTPHHNSYAESIGVPQVGRYPEGSSDLVVISPDGWYTPTLGTNQLVNDPSLFARVRPGMKFVADPGKWSRRVFSTWHFAKGDHPKDMIEAPVPFVYDIPTDKLHIGYEGTTTHQVPGKISPGGIVEGYYEPGGKITIQTYSTHPWSVRHLLDLWYHKAPQMEITGLEQTEKDGSTTKLASREGWFAPSYGVPDPVRQQISDWVGQQQWPEGTQLQSPEKYHITSFYSPEGYQDPANHQWLQQHAGQGFPAVTHSLDSFASPNPQSGLSPVVMRFHAPELSAHAEQLMNEGEARGLPVQRFEGGHKPHITVAHASAIPNAQPPAIQFNTEPLHELHSYYDSLKRTAAAEQGMHVGNYVKAMLQSSPAGLAVHKAMKEKYPNAKLYGVGGAPRDALMGKVPNDLDLLMQGVPQPEVEHMLKKLPGHADFAGKNYGVFHYYHPSGDHVEVALPRSDDYEGGQRSKADVTVDPDMPVDEDLKRRDFTANSTAVDLDTGHFHDPLGGADDIKRNVLRSSHPGSFAEDPTRLVRALTMHGRYGLQPDEQTRHEMEANGHLLRGESPDALRETFKKLIESDNPAAALRLGKETGLLGHLLPEVDEKWDFDQNNPHHNYKLGDHLMQVLDNVSRLTPDHDVRLAALLHDIGKPESAWLDPDTGFNHYYQHEDPETGEVKGADHETKGAQLAGDILRKRLNMQRVRINRVQHLIQHHMFAPFNTPKGARRFIDRVGDERSAWPRADDLLNLREADQTGKGQTPEEVAARTSAQTMRDLVENERVQGNITGIHALSVGGKDLIAMGMKPGPEMGKVLTQLQNHVIEDPSMNDRQTLLGLAKGYAQETPGFSPQPDAPTVPAV